MNQAFPRALLLAGASWVGPNADTSINSLSSLTSLSTTGVGGERYNAMI